MGCIDKGHNGAVVTPSASIPSGRGFEPLIDHFNFVIGVSQM